MNVDEEVERLKEEIQRLGQIQRDGSYKAAFVVVVAAVNGRLPATATPNNSGSSSQWGFCPDGSFGEARFLSFWPIGVWGLQPQRLLGMFTSSMLPQSTVFPALHYYLLFDVFKVTFGVLFNDDRCANIFEALVGTLRAAKKRKVVAYDGELLLQGVHDNVETTLKAKQAESST